MIGPKKTIKGIRLPDTTPPAVGFGRLPSPQIAKEKYPLRAALARPRKAETLPARKRWRLYRAAQLDQGSTPQCVAYTGKHWESSLPTYTKTGLAPGELYARCKKIDPWPGEDGTSADALLQVYRAIGKVKSWHWYANGDKQSADTWLLTKGPLWFGSGWTESMFRTDDRGVMDVIGPMQYGHEVLVIGYDRTTGLYEICNSWGNTRFGLLGRGFLRRADFWRLVDGSGDLVGVEETK
jgi:hypothetical protein